VIYVTCPECGETKVEIYDNNLTNCRRCEAALSIPVQAVVLRCSHTPRPVRGIVERDGATVPYEFCSGECSAEAGV
jgi:ribosomal protein L37AE/L43A